MRSDPRCCCLRLPIAHGEGNFYATPEEIARLWEPTYREVRVGDLRSVSDLADIAFDGGVQLGAGKAVSVRSQELASNTKLEQRLRTATSTIVEELLAGWRVLAAR